MFGLYLLRSAAYKGLGVQDGVKLPQDGGKVRVPLDSGQQVVVTALLFHHGCCLLGQNADLLVAILQNVETCCFEHKTLGRS